MVILKFALARRGHEQSVNTGSFGASHLTMLSPPSTFMLDCSDSANAAIQSANVRMRGRQTETSGLEHPHFDLRCFEQLSCWLRAHGHQPFQSETWRRPTAV